MYAVTKQPHYVREVEGELVSSASAATSIGRVEILRRRATPQLHWRFCQPELTLFWHRAGFRQMRGSIDGRAVDCTFSGSSRLSIFPAGAQIEMDFELDAQLEYSIIFIDPAKIGSRFPLDLRESNIAFTHELLLRGLAELNTEADGADNLFELFAEGLVHHALAYIARMVGRSDEGSDLCKGGLTARARSKVDQFIRDNLAEPLTLDELALVAGLSKRHFLRSFNESMGLSPHRYIVALRIEEAKRQLSDTSKPITGIALDCGFSHAQHFATSFRRIAGTTPSEFRHRAH